MSLGGQTPVFVMSKIHIGCAYLQQRLISLVIQMPHLSDNLGGKPRLPTSLLQKYVPRYHSL
jgi:hypothetical protein